MYSADDMNQAPIHEDTVKSRVDGRSKGVMLASYFSEVYVVTANSNATSTQGIESLYLLQHIPTSLNKFYKRTWQGHRRGKGREKKDSKWEREGDRERKEVRGRFGPDCQFSFERLSLELVLGSTRYNIPYNNI